jgi:hypothetical protein
MVWLIVSSDPPFLEIRVGAGLALCPIRVGADHRVGQAKRPVHGSHHVMVAANAPAETGKDKTTSNAPPASFHPQVYRQVGDQV